MGKNWFGVFKDHIILRSSQHQNSDESNMTTSSSSSMSNNIIQNHDFSNGMHMWYTNCCGAIVVQEGYAVISNRKQTWEGLEQDITTRISSGVTYTLSAHVGVSGTNCADVTATLRLEYHGSETKYMFITRASVSKDKWETLEGSFVLSDKPDRVVFYLEGPDPGVNILVQSVLLSYVNNSHGRVGRCDISADENIILNPEFEERLNKWSGRGCKISVHNSNGKIVPKSGKYFASATQRTHSWNGIQQDITARVERKLAYNVVATVSIFNAPLNGADIKATLWVQTSDSREQYIGIANAHATDKEWIELKGKFLLNCFPSKVVIFLEGPPPDVDILLNGFVVKRAEKIPPSPPPLIENVHYGVNIIANSNLREGTKNWFPLGNCVLRVATGSPRVLPPAARHTLGSHEPLSGNCIHATNRTETWMGPAQVITLKVKLYVTYQVSVWVRLVSGPINGPQIVNVALGVDEQWVNGGQVEISDDMWHEISGSFRIEKQHGKVMAYVQGPAPGICFMVAGFQIFAVDRRARFKQLKQKTDKIRKCDITLKFSKSDSSNMHGTTVMIKQIQNSFPIGSCINRTNIDNEDFVDFFLKNFNWAVFGNELKWSWTESQRGNYNYKGADELLKFCDNNNLATRGHCIFWEVEDTIQKWVRNLNNHDLALAVENPLHNLLNRYKGRFRHHDVNNEMLHGSFYQDRLGKDIRANMFKTANRLDPSAVLFMNDYQVEDGHGSKSSPEKYIEQILDLKEQGAPVGGIGIQGHIDSPVGSIVCKALDKLEILGLPIWIPELDVTSLNEHVRADDLEVMMREAFAHPSVEGISFGVFGSALCLERILTWLTRMGRLMKLGRGLLSLGKSGLLIVMDILMSGMNLLFEGLKGCMKWKLLCLATRLSRRLWLKKGIPGWSFQLKFDKFSVRYAV